MAATRLIPVLKIVPAGWTQPKGGNSLVLESVGNVGPEVLADSQSSSSSSHSIAVLKTAPTPWAWQPVQLPKNLSHSTG